MKIIISLLLVLITLHPVSAQDLLKLDKDITIFNSYLSLNELSYDVKLVDILQNFKGYLVIKIDDNTIEKRNIRDNIDTSYVFYSEVFWVDSLSNISNNPKNYYYHDLEYFVGLHSNLYKNGYKDDLNFFSSNLIEFSKANSNKIKIYLLDTFAELNTNLLINVPYVYEEKVNPNVKYVIYKTEFSAAVVEFNYENKIGKVFVPFSYLRSFSILEPSGLKAGEISLSKFKIIEK